MVLNRKKDMCECYTCLFAYRQKKECVIDRLETRGNRGFFARPNSPRRTNTIPLSPVTGITFKKYTMQQFLLLRTPPRFFYRVHGLKHFTHTRSFACNAICFLVLYWHIPGARLFLSCYMYSMLKKYSF